MAYLFRNFLWIFIDCRLLFDFFLSKLRTYYCCYSMRVISLFFFSESFSKRLIILCPAVLFMTFFELEILCKAPSNFNVKDSYPFKQFPLSSIWSDCWLFAFMFFLWISIFEDVGYFFDEYWFWFADFSYFFFGLLIEPIIYGEFSFESFTILFLFLELWSIKSFDRFSSGLACLFDGETRQVGSILTINDESEFII